jgi:O-antigen ligase
VVRALEQLAFRCLCAFAFTLAWGESLSTLGGLVIENWFGLMAIGLVALRIAIAWQVRKPSPLHYWMLALVGWSALSVLWTMDWDSTVTRTGTYIQLLMLAWVIWESARTEIRVRGLLQSYVLGALVSSGLTIYNFLLGRTAAQLAADQGIDVWETSRYSIAGLNANDLGLMLALSIPMAFYLLVTQTGTAVKLLCWLQVMAGMVTILLTASRGSLVAALVGFTMLPLTIKRLPRWHRFASLAACLGLLAWAVYMVPQTSWSRIFRFESEISEGTLTHRTLLWAAGIDAFRDRAFLGVGAGAYGLTVYHAADFAYTTGNAANAVAHNTFLSVLVELGVIGALLLLGLLAGIFYCALRMRYLERCLWITLLLTWSVGVSALTWEYRKPTWLLFGLVAAHVFSRRITNHAPVRAVPERS